MLGSARPPLDPKARPQRTEPTSALPHSCRGRGEQDPECGGTPRRDGTGERPGWNRRMRASPPREGAGEPTTTLMKLSAAVEMTARLGTARAATVHASSTTAAPITTALAGRAMVRTTPSRESSTPSRVPIRTAGRRQRWARVPIGYRDLRLVLRYFESPDATLLVRRRSYRCRLVAPSHPCAKRVCSGEFGSRAGNVFMP
jgi:hypothetical protein